MAHCKGQFILSSSAWCKCHHLSMFARVHVDRLHAAWNLWSRTVHIATALTAHASDNKMDACFEERLCKEIRRYPHLTINSPPREKSLTSSLCLSVLRSSRQLFIQATPHLAGVTLLLKTQGSAVSSVKLLGWVVLQKAASSNTGGQAISPFEQAHFQWALH